MKTMPMADVQGKRRSIPESLRRRLLPLYDVARRLAAASAAASAATSPAASLKE